MYMDSRRLHRGGKEDGKGFGENQEGKEVRVNAEK
jgi:hypothetical protein